MFGFIPNVASAEQGSIEQLGLVEKLWADSSTGPWPSVLVRITNDVLFALSVCKLFHPGGGLKSRLGFVTQGEINLNTLASISGVKEMWWQLVDMFPLWGKLSVWLVFLNSAFSTIFVILLLYRFFIVSFGYLSF